MSALVLCDARPFTGNATTASRLCGVLADAGLPASVFDVSAAGAVQETAAAASAPVVLVAIHAHKGGQAALARLAAASPPPPPLVVVLSGTDVNQSHANGSDVLRVCRAARSVVALSPCLASRYAALAATVTAAATASSPILPPLPRCIFIPQAACSEAELSVARARAGGAELRAACGLPPGAPVALLVAGIRPVKAPGFLLAAFLAQAARPPVHLALVGPVLDEALFAELRRGGLALAGAGAAGEPPPLAQYLPPVPRAELMSWLAQASVVLNSSESEGASCALLEAMSVGAAVVARRIEGNVALVRHGETGLLFDSPGEALDCCRRVCGYAGAGAAVDARALRAAAAAYARAEHSSAAEAEAWRTVMTDAGVLPRPP